jgi:O-succinylbenzoic acid--CoA ligase
MTSWVEVAAGKHPDRVAFELGERSITYDELRQRAIEGAQALAASGLEPGDRIAIDVQDSFEFALALHSCLVAGVAAVPIDLRLGQAEQAARRAAAEIRAKADDVATVMHTSGTMSEPKPVELTYGNWLASAVGSAVAVGLDPAERWLCPMPVTHVGGLSILIRSLIYATTAVLHERFDTEAVVSELMDADRRITMVSLVPTMLARLLDHGLEDPPTLRWALLGGAPIASALRERAAGAGVPVAPTYGMTEGCSQLFTFGFPLPGVDFMLHGPEQEIVVRGPMVAPGALGREGWLHTGDLGRTDERGRLEIVGRRSDTIITGGENVSPQEVEAVLQAHPGVADTAVVGRSDPEWGQALVALVVPRDGEHLDVEELRGHCRSRLAAFKVPKRFELVGGLPRTLSGKLLRRQIR